LKCGSIPINDNKTPNDIVEFNDNPKVGSKQFIIGKQPLSSTSFLDTKGKFSINSNCQ